LTAALAFSPEIVIALAGIGVLVFDALWPGRGRVERWMTLGAMAAAATCAVLVSMSPALYGTYFSGMLRVDATTTFARLLFMAAGSLIVLSSWATQGEGDKAEYYGLLLLSFLGEAVIVSAQTLLLLFIGIELLALPCYALMAIRRHLAGAVRAALKYFLLGMFASIVMLYGVALLFGSLHTISYAAGLFPDPATLGAARAAVAMLAFLFLFVGVGFKVTAFPFHFWSPDVYATGSTPIVAYVATVPKVAVMLALWRMLGPGFGAAYPLGQAFIAIVAVASMVYGNVVALMQDDVRRMLAYSGIANTGYMLVALAAGGTVAFSALMFFLVVYTFTNLGAFFIVLAVSGQERSVMADFAGLGKRGPFLAFAMAIFMFSLAGTPPLAGFFGKFALFRAAVEQGFWYLALAALLNSVISVGYYLRVTQQMYGTEPAFAAAPGGDLARVRIAPPLRAAIVLTVAATLLLGVFGIRGLTGLL
jgi:NADH-quinone oxidoreductase subunit N